MNFTHKTSFIPIKIHPIVIFGFTHHVFFKLLTLLKINTGKGGLVEIDYLDHFLIIINFYVNRIFTLISIKWNLMHSAYGSEKCCCGIGLKQTLII